MRSSAELRHGRQVGVQAADRALRSPLIRGGRHRVAASGWSPARRGRFGASAAAPLTRSAGSAHAREGAAVLRTAVRTAPSRVAVAALGRVARRGLGHGPRRTQCQSLVRHEAGFALMTGLEGCRRAFSDAAKGGAWANNVSTRKPKHSLS